MTSGNENFGSRSAHVGSAARPGTLRYNGYALQQTGQRCLTDFGKGASLRGI